MAELESTTASLRFFGDTLDPDELTALLGGPPTDFCRKGDLRVFRDGRERREKWGSWRRVVERRAPGDLDAQVQELFSGLTDDLAVWKQISDRFRSDVFCGLFMQEANEGISISPQALLAISSRGLELDLDIYGSVTEPSELNDVDTEE